MDKDKLFLVFYLNVENILPEDVGEYLYNFAKLFTYDESVERLIIPTREGENRVECINPVLLTDEQYKEVEEKVKSLEQEVETALKSLNDD
jgi:hypothetical protein